MLGEESLSQLMHNMDIYSSDFRTLELYIERSARHAVAYIGNKNTGDEVQKVITGWFPVIISGSH